MTDPSPAPDPPLTIIGPAAGHGWDLFREVWRYRELLGFLVWRDVAIRYKQTAVGVLWAVVQPVAVMAVLAFTLGRVAGQPGASVPYWLFVLTGLVPWLFVSGAVAGAGQSVVANQQLVTKVYFPRVLLPLSAAGLAAVDCAVGAGVLVPALPLAGVVPGWHLLLLPVALAVLLLVAGGPGLLLAAVTVKYRDFRVVMPFLMQLWLFLTPAVYLQADAAVGPAGRAVQLANPAHGAIVAFRHAVLGSGWDGPAVAAAAGTGLVLVVAGLWYFQRVERDFADVI